jgi:hypothetical protein
MSYEIACRSCHKESRASEIVELIQDHTNEIGKFLCSHCGSTDTYIYRESNLQEKGLKWKRWIKGIIVVGSDEPTYVPYIFLTASAEDAMPNGLHFHYYKDTRSHPGGKLKHGHGPGGPPVLEKTDLFKILERLTTTGMISRDDIKQFAARL